jgi:glucose/arabinose dehydrogenase
MRLAKISANLIAAALLVALVGPAASAQAKPSKKAPAKKPSAAETQPAPTASAKREEPPVSKRDPFEALVGKRQEGPSNLPPGKAGLVIATVRVDGAVRSPSGMIAVLSNPQQRVYFVREGDRLYDGSVEKIALDGVVFRENSKDAFGKPIEREVTKRIYASAGDQQ